MNTSRMLITLCLLFCLASCDMASKPAAKGRETPPPGIDLSTPDKALKSYWAVLDWGLSPTSMPTPEQLAAMKRISDTFNRVVGPEMARPARVERDQEVFERDIMQVSVETASRAVILARVRNVSPIPDGVEATARDLKKREDGDPYRYVIEKIGDDWRVTEVWEQGYGSSGWSRTFRSRKSKPMVPTMTFQGA